MKINAGEIRVGMLLEYKNDLWQVLKTQHVKPGKGPAFVRTKLKGIEDGRVVDHTFSAGHKIEVVRIENRSYQYLYKDGLPTFHSH